ncbi:MAG: TetR/AcrR family transcriptional regulator [Dehalococcoidia bacterium]|nr:TetR/AcrR family transcriptional regulator [Dehalococcoidia bacterium]
MSDTKNKILEAAAALFAEDGFANTSTREIARAADVSETSIFRLFGNKENVLRAIFQTAWTEINVRCEVIRGNEPDVIETLVAIAADVFLYLRERPKVGRIFLLESRTTGNRKRQATLITPELVQFGRIIEELIEQGQREEILRPGVNAQAVRQALIGMSEGMLLGWVWQESTPDLFKAEYDEEEALTTFRCLLEGLRQRTKILMERGTRRVIRLKGKTKSADIEVTAVSGAEGASIPISIWKDGPPISRDIKDEGPEVFIVVDEERRGDEKRTTKAAKKKVVSLPKK